MFTIGYALVGHGRVYLLRGSQFRSNERFLFFPPGSWGGGHYLGSAS